MSMDMDMSETMSKPFWNFSWASFADAHADEIARTVLEALQRECPEGEGETAGQLRDSLQYQKTTGPDYVRLEFTSDVPYVMFVIKGTADHDIYPVNAKVLHFFSAAGDEVFAHSVHHPGSTPDPFNERAWENVQDEVTLMFGQKVQASIT